MDDRDQNDVQKRLADQIRLIAEARGLIRAEIARRSGLPPDQVSNFLNGTRGMAIERVGRIAEAVGAVLLVERHEDSSAPTAQVDSRGFILPISAHFPCLIQLDSDGGIWRAGDIAHIEPASEWAEGRWLVVRTREGLRFVRGVASRGVELLELLSGDQLVYEADKHAVVGVAVRRSTAL